VRGIVASAGRLWIIATPAAPGAAPVIAEVPAERLAERREWRCDADQLERPPLPAGLLAGAAPAGLPEGATYSANVAIETDYEFFQLFGNTTAEIDYIADLFAYSSSIYAAQVDTSLAVGYVSLWTTPADPWSAGSTSTMLAQFRSYWISNHSDVVRTVAHFLGGRSLGGGIAYIGALCSNSIGYGLSMDLDGNFDIGSPSVVWDIVVVSHEIGHNFSSPHTHCYAGIGGNPSPVDMCYGSESGCYAGPTSLPGPPGVGSGTIMGYCHLIPPGFGNVSLTFGLGHPYGVAPERVPNLMSAYVAALAGSNPACFAAPVPASVSDAPPVVEGDSGATNATFTVTLAQPSLVNVSVSYATANGTAQAGSDYTAAAGAVTLAAGATSAPILVAVAGETAIELDETFFVNLTGGNGVTIGDGQGQGTISNDDFPALVMGDAAAIEGDAGASSATFTVELSAAGLLPVTVGYSTADATATAGSDYTASSGSLSFSPGTTSQALSVPVLGDTAVESDETFLVSLGAPANGTIAVGQGTGYIADDDASSLSRNELLHGSEQAGDLGAADTVFYRINQAPRSSYEVVVDATSGGMVPVLLERLAADNATVLQAATPVTAGGTSVSLRWSNPSPGPVGGQHLRLRGGCTGTCTASDAYRIRAWDTTLRLARFNNSSTQVTVLVIQNSGSDAVAGTLSYWGATGALLASQAFTASGRSTFVVNTSAVPGLQGKSGSATVSHDGRHGALAGKAVSVEPATGFTFDTPLAVRPR
jgi:hypothetical protein